MNTGTKGWLQIRSNCGLAEKGSKSKAGGLRRLLLLLFGLGIVLVVDLQGLLTYDHEQQGMPQGFLQETPCGHTTWKSSV